MIDFCVRPPQTVAANLEAHHCLECSWLCSRSDFLSLTFKELKLVPVWQFPCAQREQHYDMVCQDLRISVACTKPLLSAKKCSANMHDWTGSVSIFVAFKGTCVTLDKLLNVWSDVLDTKWQKWNLLQLPDIFGSSRRSIQSMCLSQYIAPLTTAIYFLEACCTLNKLPLDSESPDV